MAVDLTKVIPVIQDPSDPTKFYVPVTGLNDDGTPANIGASTVDQSTFTTNSSKGNLMFGVYQSSPDTLTNNQAAAMGLDNKRNAKVVEQFVPKAELNTEGIMGVAFKPTLQASALISPATYQNAGAATKANIKGSAGNVMSIQVTNANASARYFQIHNKATAPAGSDNALEWYFVPAGTAANPGILELGADFFNSSIYCSLGIGWAISTTAASFTDSATASDHTVTVKYAPA